MCLPVAPSDFGGSSCIFICAVLSAYTGPLQETKTCGYGLRRDLLGCGRSTEFLLYYTFYEEIKSTSKRVEFVACGVLPVVSASLHAGETAFTRSKNFTIRLEHSWSCHEVSLDYRCFKPGGSHCLKVGSEREDLILPEPWISTPGPCILSTTMGCDSQKIPQRFPASKSHYRASSTGSNTNFGPKGMHKLPPSVGWPPQAYVSLKST